MSEPSFELPQTAQEAPRRHFGGWLSLFAILAALCGLNLYSYFSRDRSGSGSEFVGISNRFRSTVMMHEVGERFKLPGLSGSQRSEALLADSYADLINEVVGDRKSSAPASRLYAAIRFEKGDPVRPEDVAVLAKSKKPEERAFAEVYTAPKLTPERAEALTAKFPDRGFSYVMAEIHAFSKAGDESARKRLLPDSEILQPMAAAFMLLAAFGIGCVVLTVYLVVRMAGHWKPLGHPAGVLTSRQADAFAGVAAVMLFSYIAIGTGFSLLFGDRLRGEAVSILGGVFAILAAVLLLTRGRSAHGPGTFIYGFDRSKLGADILWGFCGFFAGVPLFMTCAIASQSLFSGLPSPEHPIMYEIQANQSLPMLLVFLGIASVIAPIFEETCFRGTIAPAMATLFGGPFMGIFASSLAFAMIHPQGIAGWFPLATIGAVAAMLTYQRRSLVSAIVYHAVHNCFVLTMSVLML